MNKKVLARYIRLSQEEEGEGESNSITNQRELLKTYVKSSPDLSQYEEVEFCDDGYSGTNFERPGVKALLEGVRAGNINSIIVKDFSRFGRNYIDTGDYLEQIFPFLGIRFISVNDHFDSSDFEGTTGGIDVGFKNLIYALYSRDLSQKIQSAKKSRMKKGEFISSHAPYGYIKSLKDRKKLAVDEKSAAIVRRIFTMANEGKNAVRIAAILNSENIPTPYSYRRLMGCSQKFNVIGDSNDWHNTTILAILRDERYTGKMVSGKTRSSVVGCRHGKRVPKSDWIMVPNTHEAIISKKLFDSVQEHFLSPARIEAKQVRARSILGKVKCGVCGHAMRRSHSSPARAYYYCESHRYAADSDCTKDKVSEISLIQTVLSVIHTQMEVMLDREQLFNQVKKQNYNNRINLTEQIRHLQSTRSKLEASKIKTYEKYRNGTLDRNCYMSKKTNISKEIEEIDSQIYEQQEALQNLYQENSEPCSILEGFKQYEGFTELSREMVGELIDSIYIYKRESIEILWNYRSV